MMLLLNLPKEQEKETYFVPINSCCKAKNALDHYYVLVKDLTYGFDIVSIIRNVVVPLSVQCY